MANDGEIDYRELDVEQLRDALRNIDAEQYPTNYARLRAELQARLKAPRATATGLESAVTLEVDGPPYFSYGLLALAFSAALYVLIFRRPLSLVFVFPMQVSVIGSLWASSAARRRLPSVPVPDRVAKLLMAFGCIGALVAMLGFSVLFRHTDPAGHVATSIHSQVTDGVCRFTFNRRDVVVRPLSECEQFDAEASLAFSGGWIIFCSLGAWLALSTARAPKDSSTAAGEP